MPGGSVARMNSTVPGHSTSRRGAWTATSCSRGTIRDSRTVIAWLSLPPLVEIETRAPARIVSWQAEGSVFRVLRNPDWVAPVLFVLRLLRPLRWFGLVECRGEDATRTGHGEWPQDAAVRPVRAVRSQPVRNREGHRALSRAAERGRSACAIWWTDPGRLGTALVSNPGGLESALPLRPIRSLFGRNERRATTARDLGLNPAGFDAMTGVARVACGDYGSVNECEGLRSPNLPTGYKAGVSGKQRIWPLRVAVFLVRPFASTPIQACFKGDSFCGQH